MIDGINTREFWSAAKRVVTRERAEADGLTAATVTYRVKSGRWQRLERGVFLTDPAKPSFEARLLAASMAFAPHGCVSHGTAALIHRLDGVDWLPRDIHLTLLEQHHRKSDHGHSVHVTRRLDPPDVVTRYKMRCTSLARTVIDLFETVEDRRIKVMAFEDCWRRDPFAQMELLHTIERLRSGLRNVDELEKLIYRHPANMRPTESAAEALADDLIWQLAPTERQIDFYDQRGHIGRVDLIVRALQIAIEVDSRKAHEYDRSFDNDPLRDQRLRALGWETHRITWKHLMDPRGLSDRLEAAFSRRRDLIGKGQLVIGPMPTIQQTFDF